MTKGTRVWARVQVDRKAVWKAAASAEERSLSKFISLAADDRVRNPPAISSAPSSTEPAASPPPSRKSRRKR